MKKRIHIVQGAPGTGKTHKLLQILEEQMKTIPAKEIAFVSFSRKGTYAGVDRAKEAFDLTDEDCKYFKTLHSLAYHALHKTHQDMFISSPAAKKMNAVLRDWGVGSKELREGFNCISKVRELMSGTLEDVSDNARQLNVAHAIKSVYSEAKELSGTQDFTDLLEECLQKEIVLPVKIAFIDEAQDLTPLQWNVARKFFANCTDIWIAGDNNQALFTWAGADPEAFFSLNKSAMEIIQLDKSYRCSGAVWAMAKHVQNAIVRKDAMPLSIDTDNAGWAELTRRTDYATVKMWLANLIAENVLNESMRKKTIMCLGRTGQSLTYSYLTPLMELGVPFRLNMSGMPVHMCKDDIFNRLKRVYERFHVRATYDAFYRRVHDYKTGGTHSEILDLLKIYGCPTRKDFTPAAFPFGFTPKFALQWATVELIKSMRAKFISFHVAQWLLRMFISGRITWDDNDILVSTIHRQKGGEADYVLMNAGVQAREMSAAAMDFNARDDIMRQYYVGITRAKIGCAVFTMTTGLPNDVFPELLMTLPAKDWQPFAAANEVLDHNAKVKWWTRKEAPMDFFQAILEAYSEHPDWELPQQGYLSKEELSGRTKGQPEFAPI